MDFLELFGTILEDMTNSFLEGNAYIGSARVVAGIGAIIGVGTTFMKIVAQEAETNEAWKYMFKILLVSLAISFYPALIKGINVPLNVIGYQAKSVAYDQIDETSDYFRSFEDGHRTSPPSNEKYEERLQAYVSDEGIETNVDVSEEESDGILSIGKSVLFDAINGPMTKIRSYIMQAAMSTLNFFGKVAFTILNVVRTFFLIVLGIFGIFAIAFSIYPTMESSFSTWLKKYINVYLWLPIGYIMMGVINRLYKYIRVDGPTSIPEMILADPDFVVDTTSTSLLAGMLAAVSIVSTIAIPTMSSWMVNTSTAQMGSKIKGKGMDFANKAKGAGKEVAKAKATGGTSAAATASKKGLGL